MSVLVPDFRVDDGDGFSVPFSTRVEDEIMELLWEDGRLLVRRQRPPEMRAAIPAGCGEFRDGERQQHQRLFTQEDEVGSWLRYPFDVFDRGGFGSDLPHLPTPCVTSSSEADCDFGTADSGEVTTESGASKGSTRVPKAPMGESSPSISNEHTAVQPNVTTPPARSGAVRGDMRMETTNGSAVDAPPGGGATTGMGRLAQTPAASQPRMQAEKRKREGREAGEGELLSDEKDVRSESANAEKRVDKSTTAKRSCCADVHNLSERRHRDRISRKMRALQELLPWCTKVDRASLLDEAIEYLKSLQLQVQIMSMGCGVVPVVFPGVQAYMPCMNMGTATDAGMNLPMMLFPNILASLMMQPSANGAHLGPGFPISTFSMQQEASNQFKTPSPNHLDPTLSSQMIQNLSQQFPANASSFQQQLGLHYMQQPPQTH